MIEIILAITTILYPKILASLFIIYTENLYFYINLLQNANFFKQTQNFTLIMPNQRTLSDPVELTGTDLLGGCRVDVIIYPGAEDTGYMFTTPSGPLSEDYLEARIENVDPMGPFTRSVRLSNQSGGVIHSEHLLATLHESVDNAIIELNRHPSKSFRALSWSGGGGKYQVVPIFDGLQTTVCEAIEEVGTKEQEAPRKTLKLTRRFDSGEVSPKLKGRLVFEPRRDDQLYIGSKIYYPLQIVAQECGFFITPENYRNELSWSRPYGQHAQPGSMIPGIRNTWLGKCVAPELLARIVACGLYFSYGLSHGLSTKNVFYPVHTEKEWDAREFELAQSLGRKSCYGEIARHKIVDFLGGGAALLPGRLEGMQIHIYRTNHAQDLEVLQYMLGNGILVQGSQPSAAAHAETHGQLRMPRAAGARRIRRPTE